MTKYDPDGTRRPWWWLGDTANWWFFVLQLPVQVYFLTRSIYRGFDRGWASRTLASCGSAAVRLTASFFGTCRTLAAEACAVGPAKR